MPRVVITYNPSLAEYSVKLAQKNQVLDPEYQILMEMKSGHFKFFMKNMDRYVKDQLALSRFFIEGQMTGRQLRER